MPDPGNKTDRPAQRATTNVGLTYDGIPANTHSDPTSATINGITTQRSRRPTVETTRRRLIWANMAGSGRIDGDPGGCVNTPGAWPNLCERSDVRKRTSTCLDCFRPDPRDAKRGLCSACYSRRRRSGRPMPGRPKYRQPVLPGCESWHGTRSGYIRHRCRCGPCRAADREYMAQRRETYEPLREQRRAHQRAYKRRHPDRAKEQNRAQKAKHRERNRVTSKAHYEANRAYYAAKNKAWVLANRPRKGRTTLTDAERKARRKASQQRWHEANPEFKREAVRRRRARIQHDAAIVPFTLADLERRLAMWAGCWMCGGPPRAVDHVKPLARGGSHMLCNLRPACQGCNSSKGRKWRGAQWAHSLRQQHQQRTDTDGGQQGQHNKHLNAPAGSEPGESRAA